MLHRMLVLGTMAAAFAACQVEPDADSGDPPVAEGPAVEEAGDTAADTIGAANGDTVGAPDGGAEDGDMAPPADTPSADPDTVRDRFVRSGLRPIGETREAIRGSLGEPDSTTREAVQNRHDPSRTDTIIQLHYPGFTARIHRPADLDDLLDQVTVRDNRYLQQDAVRIGMPWSEVRSRLGEPEGERDGGYLYSCDTCGPVSEPIIIFVDDGAVSSIRFDYYVD